ncbi:MAG: hypothetical protein WC390_10365 [Sulfurimonas sp.]|jgi:hypothetical protein
MKPSLLNAPFNERKYQQRMDNMIRAKHGFGILTGNAAPNTVVTPTVVASTQIFCKWPAYVTFCYNNQLGFGGSFNDNAIGRHTEDGLYVYLSYSGRTTTHSTGSVRDETKRPNRFLICPELVTLILKHGGPITDQDMVAALLKKFPPIPYDEWLKLPTSSWPASVIV